MKKIIIICLLFLSFGVKAQMTYFNYLDSTVVWNNYSSGFNGIGVDTYYSTVYFDGDTLLNNHYYYKQYTLTLDSSNSGFGVTVTTQLSGPVFIREDSSLKFWQYYNGADHLSIDWTVVTNLQVGDTFPVAGANCPVNIIDSLFLLGRYLKQYHSSLTFSPNSVLEGIGQIGPLCALGVEGNGFTACFKKQNSTLQFSAIDCNLFLAPQRQHSSTYITADFSNQTVCLGSPSCFTDLSTSNNSPVDYWAWLWGDGSTSCCTTPNPCHIYPIAGTYIVTLIVKNANGDIDTVSHPIIVNPLPVITCSASPDTISASSITVLNSSASGSNPPSYSYSWAPSYAISCTICQSAAANPTISTCYTVSVTDANGCTDTCQKCITVNNTTNISEDKNDKKSVIYPNPNKGNFIIETIGKQNIQIFDITGKMVLSQNLSGKTNIDASNLDNGVYLFAVINQQGLVKTGRFVIIK
jgi:PKD repeat protein